MGGDGQEKLLNGKVLIIGAGGLGAPVALYLAAAGVGHIGIIDEDIVDISNLQRQVIHFTPDIGRPKVESAKEKMNQINPDVKVTTYYDLFTKDNALDILKDYDFVIDGTDSFPSKFLINDACVIAKKPFSHGGILRFDGQTMTHVPGTASYRCVFKDPPPANSVPPAARGVFAVAGMLGTIQAAEAIRYLTGVGDLLTNRILIFDALNMKFRTVNVKPSELDLTDFKESYDQPVCDLRSRT